VLRPLAQACLSMRSPSWCTVSSSRCGIWSSVYQAGTSPLLSLFSRLWSRSLSFSCVPLLVFVSCSRRRDESFVNYRTSTYKLHLFESVSGYRFVMLSDPNAESLRFVMRSIYTGPFLEYVVRNPLVPMDSRERGVDNEYFRASIDRLVRGLSVFQ
jgi:Sybindin-like family